MDRLYGEIITAGTHKAASIRVAEAAKVIENTQRDVNIALINELALIFNKMGIDTRSRAAGGRHQVELPAVPARAGGRALHRRRSVLPDAQGAKRWATTRKSSSAGRRLNDSMGTYVASQLVKAMTKRRIHVQGARVLVMGLTFKENCPDLRNTRVVDIVRELREYGVEVDVYDPWVDRGRSAGTNTASNRSARRSPETTTALFLR